MMTIKASLLMASLPLLQVVFAGIFLLLEIISLARPLRIICVTIYALFGAVIAMAWLFVMLTFFVYALPSIIIAILLYVLTTRTAKYKNALRKIDSIFYRSGIRIVLASILFLIPLGVTFVILHFLTAVHG